MVPGKGSVLRAVGVDSGSPWPSGDSRVAPGDFSVVLPARGWAEGQHVQENEPNSAGPGVLCSSACRQGSACCSASSPEPTHPAHGRTGAAVRTEATTRAGAGGQHICHSSLGSWALRQVSVSLKYQRKEFLPLFAK